MNIQTVADNLRNTIAGKEKALEDYRKARELASRGEDMALYATVEFLKVNIDELKRILQDVEQCEDRYQEGYEDGETAGWEQAILKERG